MPRFVLINKARYLSNEDDILFGMIGGFFDPHEKVFLSDGEANLEEPMTEGSIELKDKTSTNIMLEVKTNGDSFLVVSNTYYPGWEAFVDNEKTKILLANYGFQAIKLSQGDHKVEFVYNPKSYGIGKTVSGIGFFLLFVYLIFYYIYSRKGKYDREN